MARSEISDEMLIAFVDGELSVADRMRLQASLAEDSALAERLAVFAWSAELARDAFAEILTQPVPERLLAAIDSAQDAASKVVELPSRRRAALWKWAAPAIAASLALFLVLGIGERRSHTASLSGACAGADYTRALQSLPSGVSDKAGGACSITVIASYRAPDDALCRSFQAIDVSAHRASAALACHEAAGWVLVGASEMDRPGVGDSFRPASGSAHDPIADWRSARHLGPALTDGEEAAALRSDAR